MCRVVALTLIGFVLCACADEAHPGDGGPTVTPVDERTVGIYSAVIRDVVEFRNETVYVWTQLCPSAEGAGESGPCPDALTAEEQATIASLLADEIPEVRFVDETEAIAKEIFDGKGGELVRLGPIVEVDGRIQVPASHHCGGLCGGGSVWVVEETDDGWRISGPAPGHGMWVS